MGAGDWELTDKDVCRAWLYDRNIPRPNGEGPVTFPIDDYR